jgi:hypothetical protein
MITMPMLSSCDSRMAIVDQIALLFEDYGDSAVIDSDTPAS